MGTDRTHKGEARSKMAALRAAIRRPKLEGRKPSRIPVMAAPRRPLRSTHRDRRATLDKAESSSP